MILKAVGYSSGGGYGTTPPSYGSGNSYGTTGQIRYANPVRSPLGSYSSKEPAPAKSEEGENLYVNRAGRQAVEVLGRAYVTERRNSVRSLPSVSERPDARFRTKNASLRNEAMALSAVPAMTELLLRTRDAKLQNQIMTLLQRLGPKAKEALPAVKARLAELREHEKLGEPDKDPKAEPTWFQIVDRARLEWTVRAIEEDAG